MGELFHGWRRKVGVVMLVLACVLMVCWVRSSVIADTIFVFFKSEAPKKTGMLRGVVIADTIMVFPQQTPVVLRSCGGRLEVWHNKISASDDMTLESNNENESEVEPPVRRINDLRIAGPSISTGSSVLILATINMGGDPDVDPGVQWITPRTHVGIPEVFNQLPASKHWQMSGFAYGFDSIEFDFVQGKEKLRMEAWGVPYWFIILSIALISAFLLLSKPRKSTPMKIIEPIPKS